MEKQLYEVHETYSKYLIKGQTDISEKSWMLTTLRAFCDLRKTIAQTRTSSHSAHERQRLVMVGSKGNFFKILAQDGEKKFMPTTSLLIMMEDTLVGLYSNGWGNTSRKV